ncbi:MAG: hypothetical protein LKH11_04300 [Solobacterium sp.]|nr:hypothetical protein [Solobacterium sp.]MCI1345894.1 hypothetical protein [Solobacterium sp.]MCI1407554.1 hypothetical protein [Solobacterium sp.]MCI1435612.1 hypothetical protein [Solobacterium sp.]MCI1458588.1 hypothetical protein [Solobacterium sp.]
MVETLPFPFSISALPALPFPFTLKPFHNAVSNHTGNNIHENRDEIPKHSLAPDIYAVPVPFPPVHEEDGSNFLLTADSHITIIVSEKKNAFNSVQRDRQGRRKTAAAVHMKLRIFTSLSTACTEKFFLCEGV